MRQWLPAARLTCLARLFGWVVVAGGCSGLGAPGNTNETWSGERAEFVNVMRELQAAEPPDRPAILEKHGTTAAAIRAYALELANDPPALSQALDSIQIHIDRDRFSAPEILPPRFQN